VGDPTVSEAGVTLGWRHGGEQQSAAAFQTALASVAPPKPFPGFWQSVALFLVFYIIFILTGVLLTITLGSSGLAEGSLFFVIQLLVAWAATFALAILWSGQSWVRLFPIEPFPPRIIAPLILMFTAVTMLLAEVVTWIPMPESLAESIEETFGPNPLATFVAMVIVAPLTEEPFFRGLVLRGWLARYSTVVGVVGSSLFFGAFHLNPWQAVLAVPLGLLLAWVFMRTGSLMPAIIGHGACNLTAMWVAPIVLLLMGYSAEEIEQAAHYPRPFLIGAAVVFVVSGLWLHRALPAAPPGGWKAVRRPRIAQARPVAPLAIPVGVGGPEASPSPIQPSSSSSE
jgi:hypothetical protein